MTPERNATPLEQSDHTVTSIPAPSQADQIVPSIPAQLQPDYTVPSMPAQSQFDQTVPSMPAQSQSQSDHTVPKMRVQSQSHRIVNSAPVQSIHTAPVGSIIANSYQIQQLIGVGGMSAVYKAHHVALDKMVALKMLHHQLCSDKHSLERFMQEGRTEGRVRHPNIVAVQSVGATPDGRVYLVMDYLEGKSLDEILRLGGPLPEAAARNIFIQICDALSYAHSMGLIHRDLKPSNVMLVGPNLSIVKIVDFGIAKLVGEGAREGQAITGDNNIVGSPPYMSPEQCLGNTLDSRSDLYSLGCLMYEVLTGKLPFIADSHYATICMHLTDEPIAPRDMRSGKNISASLESIVLKAMKKVPDERYSTAEEIIRDLKGSSGDAAIATSSTRPALRDKASATLPLATTPTTHRKSRKKATAVSAILCTLIVTGAVVANWDLCGLWLTLPGLQQRLGEAETTYGPLSTQAKGVVLDIADAYWKANDRPKAQGLYRSALSVMMRSPVPFQLSPERQIEIAERAANSPEEEQQCLVLLGEMYKHGGLNAQAAKLFQASVDIPKALPYLQVQTLITLAEIASVNQNYYTEQRHVERALTLYQSSNEKSSSNMVLSALLLKRAECDELLGKPASAAEWYHKALELMPNSGSLDSLRRAGYFRRIGQCLWASSRYEEGSASIFQAISEYSKVKPANTHEIAECYRMLGDKYMQTSHYAKAQKYYEKTLTLAATLQPEEVLQAKESLADCLFHLKEYAKQKTLLESLIAEISKDPLLTQQRIRLEQKLSECLTTMTIRNR